MARILVMDDDPDMRRALRWMLEHAGHEVIDAPDGKAGVRLYMEKPADLVITGLVMPVMDGIEVIIELRRVCSGVKIIAISGDERFGTDDYLSAAEKLGAQRSFTKPFEQLGAQRSFTKPFEQMELLEAVDELINIG